MRDHLVSVPASFAVVPVDARRRVPDRPRAPPPEAGPDHRCARILNRLRNLSSVTRPGSALEPFDVVVIGGGHNGLVAAGLLAKQGARVIVLERRDVVGGAAITEQPWGPDFKMTALSYVVSLMPPTILRELELERHGYKIYPQGPYFAPAPRRPRARAARRPARGAASRSRSSRSATPTRTSAGRRGSAASPTCSRRCSPRRPPRLGSHRPARPARPGAGSAWQARALGRRAAIADITRLFTIEHRRPARGRVRVRRDARRAVGERRDRHLGRAAVGRAPRT